MSWLLAYPLSKGCLHSRLVLDDSLCHKLKFIRHFLAAQNQQSQKVWNNFEFLEVVYYLIKSLVTKCSTKTRSLFNKYKRGKSRHFSSLLQSFLFDSFIWPLTSWLRKKRIPRKWFCFCWTFCNSSIKEIK